MYKDTVMSKEELKKINDAMPSTAKYGEVFKAIANKQAEISFPKGEKQGIDKGRKEVVEKIDKLICSANEKGETDIVTWLCALKSDLLKDYELLLLVQRRVKVKV